MTTRGGSTSAGGTVVVVGSINLDRRAEVGRLPGRGETVTALQTAESGGGKGANQAVAAAAAGAAVVLLGAVGSDESGSRLLAELDEAGVDTRRVRILTGTPSGSASVVVEQTSGDNLIIVDPGANGRLTVADLDADALAGAAVVLLQREVPDDVSRAAAAMTRGRVILNPAPAAGTPTALLECADLVVPNEHELAELTQTRPQSDPDAVVAAVLELPGDADVLVTLGRRGALLVRRPDGATASFPAPTVTAVDTTGAGDHLCGVLAAGLAAGLDLPAAVERAIAAASESTLHVGARIRRH